MAFLMLQEGHEMTNPKCTRGVKRHSSGVKHVPKGVKKNLGGLTPPNPPDAQSLSSVVK